MRVEHSVQIAEHTYRVVLSSTALVRDDASAAAAAGSTPPEMLSFITFGCCGEGSAAQRKVAAGARLVAERDGIPFAFLTGDIIYPSGVSPTDATSADTMLRELVTDIYNGLVSVGTQVCLGMGNHEPGFHGRTLSDPFHASEASSALRKADALVTAVGRLTQTLPAITADGPLAATTTVVSGAAAGAVVGSIAVAEESIPSFFMPNRYYSQEIYQSDSDVPSALVVNIDTSLLPIDIEQLIWLQNLVERYRRAEVPVFFMQHHTVAYTIGKRGKGSDEADKYAIDVLKDRNFQSLLDCFINRPTDFTALAGTFCDDVRKSEVLKNIVRKLSKATAATTDAYIKIAKVLQEMIKPANHHQRVAKIYAELCPALTSQATTCCAHEHTFSTLNHRQIAPIEGEVIADRLPLPQKQLVSGNGGATSNKQKFKVIAPDLSWTETGYGFTKVTVSSDGHQQVDYYDCTEINLAELPSSSAEFRPRFTHVYDKNGYLIHAEYRPDLKTETAIPLSLESAVQIHPKLIVEQEKWLKQIFAILETGNLSLCKLALAAFTKWSADVEAARVSEDLMDGLFSLATPTIAADRPISVASDSVGGGVMESKPIPGAASGGGASESKSISSAASAVPTTEATASSLRRGLQAYGETPTAENVRAYLIAIERLLDDYTKKKFTETFLQLSTLHFMLSRILEAMTADDRSLNFKQAVAKTKKDFFTKDGVGINSRHTKEQGLKGVPSEEASPDEAPEVEVSSGSSSPRRAVSMIVRTDGARGAVAAAPPVSGRRELTRGKSEVELSMRDGSKLDLRAEDLRRAAMFAVLGFIKVAYPDDYASKLDNLIEYPDAAAALLLSSLIHLADPKLVIAAVLASEEVASGLQDLLMNALRRVFKASEADIKDALGNKESPFTEYFTVAALQNIARNNELKGLLEQQAVKGTESLVVLSRLAAKLQAVTAACEEKTGVIYQVGAAISGLFGSCQRHRTTDLSVAELQAAAGRFCQLFAESETKAGLLVKIDGDPLLIDYFAPPGDEEVRINELRLKAGIADPGLQKLVEFCELIPALDPADYIQLRDQIIGSEDIKPVSEFTRLLEFNPGVAAASGAGATRPLLAAGQ